MLTGSSESFLGAASTLGPPPALLPIFQLQANKYKYVIFIRVTRAHHPSPNIMQI